MYVCCVQLPGRYRYQLTGGWSGGCPLVVCLHRVVVYISNHPSSSVVSFASTSTSRGRTGVRPHRISPPFFCSAYLNFSREKDSAVPSLRRSPLVGCFQIVFVFFLCVCVCGGKIPVRVTPPSFELTSQRQKVSRLPTEPPGRPVLCNIYL